MMKLAWLALSLCLLAISRGGAVNTANDVEEDEWDNWQSLDPIQRQKVINDVIQKTLDAHVPRSEQRDLAARRLKVPLTFDEIRSRVDDFAAAVTKCFQLPGLTLSLVQNDTVLMSQGYGFRDVAAGLPVTADTLFGIASTTKAMTGVLFAMLVSQGNASWDLPISNILSGFKLMDPTTARVTPRDMACHRTGVPRNDLAWATGPAIDRRTQIYNEQYFVPVHDFRYQWEYNNWMWATIGQAIEEVHGGDSWENIIARELWIPLQMSNTYANVDAAIATGNYAMPYVWFNNQVVALPKNINNLMSSIAPAGVTSSSANDMAQWLRFQINNGTVNGKPLLSLQAMQETHWGEIAAPYSSVYLPNPMGVFLEFSTYGKGWFDGVYRGYQSLFHDGLSLGHTTNVFVLPGAKLGSFVSSNTNSRYGGIAGQFISLYSLDLMLGAQPWLTVDIACKSAPPRAQQGVMDAEAAGNMRAQQMLKKLQANAPLNRQAPSVNVTGNYTHVAYGFINVTPGPSSDVPYYFQFNQASGIATYRNSDLSLWLTPTGSWALLFSGNSLPATFLTNDKGVYAAQVAVDPMSPPYIFTLQTD